MRKALGKKPPIITPLLQDECHYRQALLDAADELETRLGNDGKCSWCDDMDRKQLCFYHNLIQEMKKSAGVK